MGVGCACPGPLQAVAGMGSGLLLLAEVEMGSEAVAILGMEVMRWIVEEEGFGCLYRSEEVEGLRWGSLEMEEMTKMEEEGRPGRLL